MAELPSVYRKSSAANMKLIEWFAVEKHGAANAYDLFRPHEAKVYWALIVWKPGLLPKHHFTLWLMAHGRLKMVDRMSYKPYKLCSLSKQQEESNAHICFRCPTTRALWDKVRSWLGYRHMFTAYLDHSGGYIEATFG
ncbi:uncharacterized protein LOC122055878 [Zingiber officinale]|uniref:uncharacterized protein LOC122055878 n=1 Tax=Zingiber officinale TaxID=94328 RepID=UPI001C4AB988|nr:uncharacterized protein LOC122055878 [Zingiber officinale]